jgi:hypothetical protein
VEKVEKEPELVYTVEYKKLSKNENLIKKVPNKKDLVKESSKPEKNPCPTPDKKETDTPIADKIEKLDSKQESKQEPKQIKTQEKKEEPVKESKKEEEKPVKQKEVKPTKSEEKEVKAEKAEKIAPNIFFKDFILATVLRGLKILKVLKTPQIPKTL